MGGMGVVWVARNEATGGDVAVKFLPPSTALSPALLARLRQEARATASLSHRGIVRMFDLVETPDGRLLLVLELLHGRTLAERIDVGERILPSEAVRIALDLLSALAHVHDAGIVHRDIKPPNVFLATDPDGHVTTKLLDFGISKTRSVNPALTMQGELVGTPHYMSPEQAMGQSVDVRSDLFGMGILLYEMLTGANPFAGVDRPILSVVLMADHVAPIPSLAPALWAVIARALRREPGERFASAEAMATALRAAMSRKAGRLPRQRSRYIGAIVAASLFVWVSITTVIAPPAASSAAQTPHRARMHRTALTREQASSSLVARDVAASPRALPPARAGAAPVLAQIGFARDPGF